MRKYFLTAIIILIGTTAIVVFSVFAAGEKIMCKFSFHNEACGVSSESTNNDSLSITLRDSDFSKEEEMATTASPTVSVKINEEKKNQTVSIKLPPKAPPPILTVINTPPTPHLVATTTDQAVTVTTVTTVTEGAPIPVTTEMGSTTFTVSPIALLVGGTAHAGTSVPLSYLQIKNTGKASATLRGFWVKQNGSAPASVVIGLATVDDQGGSRGQNGGLEGATPFKDGIAFAPTDALFLPGQRRLFTIKGILSGNLSTVIGLQLMIDVISVETSAIPQSQFPIRGTTWTLSN